KVKNKSKHYKNYSYDRKLLFVYYNRIKLFKSKRTAQKWTKKFKDWIIFEKRTNTVNKPAGQLEKRHKIYLFSFYDSHPQAKVTDVVVSITEKFEGLTLKETSVKSFLKTKCYLLSKKKTFIIQLLEMIQPKLQTAIIAWVEKWNKIDMNYLKSCIFFLMNHVSISI
ncbi:uncharacterized protein BX663DRAFT_426714, partial [Cokeromyces recurvatus]|uniref:uncharacterized protein n=1 Tax=Cokeromyces recurvatus TaxID=90255 RepID=UPI002220D167